MKKFLMYKYIYLLIGGIFLFFSGLNFHNPIASILAPVFLLNFSRRANKRNIILLFIIISIIGGASQTSNNLLGLPIVNIMNGIMFGLFSIIPYLLDRYFYKKNNTYLISLIFPCSIVLIEFIVSHLIGTWGSQAHSFYQFTHFRQLASITGIYGIWFFTSWIATSCLYIYENRMKISKTLRPILILSVIFLLILIHGKYKITISENTKEKIKVATIRSNLDLHKLVMKSEANLFKKLATNPKAKIPTNIFSDSVLINNLIDKTKTASANGAKIIVWNEASLILNKNQKDKLVSRLMQLSKSEDVLILPAILTKANNLTEKAFDNISILISPSGVKWEYSKSFLQPTAEAPLINEGKYKIPFIDTKFGRLGNLICADLDMQHYCIQAGEKQIDILLVPAYDWKAITPLHSNMASIQAIQFGCSIIRANGNGESAIFDSNGNKTSSLNSFESDEQIMYGEISLTSTTTIFNKIGNSFVYLCILILLIIFLQTKFNSLGISLLTF